MAEHVLHVGVWKSVGIEVAFHKFQKGTAFRACYELCPDFCCNACNVGDQRAAVSGFNRYGTACTEK